MTTTTDTNICFTYLYRDASNYKQHGEVIFSNETLLPIEEIKKRIRSSLKDGEFFIARQIHLEKRFFDALYDDDHPWHEFVRVTTTDDPIFDPENWKIHKHKRDITQFLAELDKARCSGWDEMNAREDLVRQFLKQKSVLQQRIEPGGEGLV